MSKRSHQKQNHPQCCCLQYYMQYKLYSNYSEHAVYLWYLSLYMTKKFYHSRAGGNDRIFLSCTEGIYIKACFFGLMCKYITILRSQQGVIHDLYIINNCAFISDNTFNKIAYNHHKSIS